MIDEIKDKKPLSLEEAIHLLDPDEIEEMEPVSMDPLGLSALAARIARRLVSTGGRPTDASWTIARRVPMKERTWARLEQESGQFANRGVRVAPGQLAAIALEKGLVQLTRESLQGDSGNSTESWGSGDYAFQEDSEEEARELVGAINRGGLW